MTTHADVVLTATLAAAAGVTDRQELKRLDDSATIYKRAGPILVKQDLDMSKSTVKERIDFIKAQLCVASRRVVWCGVVWRRVVWRHVVWRCVGAYAGACTLLSAGMLASDGCALLCRCCRSLPQRQAGEGGRCQEGRRRHVDQ